MRTVAEKGNLAGMVKTLFVVTATVTLVGCSAAFWPLFESQRESMLASGLRQYEDGNYRESARLLRGALDAGLDDAERVTAYKHLAFINCAEGHERQCREHFIRALTLNPRLELAPAEAGHPVWGPVFRAVKAGN